MFIFINVSDETDLHEELQKVFNKIREQGANQNKNSNSYEEEENVKFYFKKRNLDFTDLLWNVLKKCQSYQELKNCLKIVFDAIKTGHIRPQIHVRNTTWIGREAKALMRGQTQDTELTGAIPLQMLIEIGIEKLKKDYINIF